MAIRSVNVLHHVMIHNAFEGERQNPVKQRGRLENADFASHVLKRGIKIILVNCFEGVKILNQYFLTPVGKMTSLLSFFIFA